jgi:hypothetical protein
MGHVPEHQYYSWANQKETRAMQVGWNQSIHVCMFHVQNLLVFLDELYVLHLLYHLQEEIGFPYSTEIQEVFDEEYIFITR